MKRTRAAAAEEEMVEELKRAAQALGFEVREEDLLREVGYRARSGSCRVGERRVILIDRRLPAADRLDAIAGALADQDLEQVFLSPAARARLARRRPAVPSLASG